ncbi:hypothetical protein TCAL_06021 [Tigriopus californicus]|uniref:Uncharacterized protein n=1 Tax=Tigriopus californicus TaxID=6832 RepID=A0A553P731_TIGCA|nr:hypothetical protein TCAL_06021 [Tigriopus californicus]|eukprot:TCALIF_06021-PA protein Name:"Protein of unknown function" AED:0.05 eAED:0.05 QI:190/1/1/1/0.61/0.5/14/2500/186
MAVGVDRLEIYQIKLFETYSLFTVNIIILLYGLVTNIFESLNLANTCTDIAQELTNLKDQLPNMDMESVLANVWIASSCHKYGNFSEVQKASPYRTGKLPGAFFQFRNDKWAHSGVCGALLIVYIYLSVVFVRELCHSRRIVVPDRVPYRRLISSSASIHSSFEDMENDQEWGSFPSPSDARFKRA